MRTTSRSCFLTPGIRTFSLRIAVFALALIVVGCDSANELENPTVADVATSRSDLTVLANALQQAELTDDLGQRDTSFTVFAPANSAFESIDTEELGANGNLLDEVLSYHVVPGRKLMAADLENGQRLPTLADDSLTVALSGSSVQVNDDTLETTDLEAANGVVHVLTGVLLEGVNADHRLLVSPEHALFSSLVAEADLNSVLSGPGPDSEDGLTVFAPTDEAILAAYDDDDDGELDDSEGPANVEAWVKYHLIDDVYSADDIPSSATDVPTLEGSNVTIQRGDDQVTVNDAAVSTPDRRVENGVVHTIDGVLTDFGS